MDNLQSEKLKYSPSVNSLLKISLGLILFTLLSSALVYAETMSVDIEGNSFDVDYTVTGMTVSGVEADLDFISLILTVDVTDSPGTLDITFDRSFFDSIFEGLDDDFIILADGDEPSYTETETTTQSRTLSIELPSGTEEVEIIGSVFGDTVPVEETPVEEPPVEETPVEEPPVEETPVEEPPVEETPSVDDTPKTQCGPGTVLKDDACVLDERCGPGTVLKDDACVLTSTPQSPEITVKGLGSELVIGTIAAFGIAAAIGIILALISRADTRKKSATQ
ncbi:MAG: hypothetical protein HRO68_07280 [Nitrosopumilus sp.]|nr:hypothetical protein [Nitrosopumilus sp.]